MKQHQITRTLVIIGFAAIGSIAVMTCTPKNTNQPGADTTKTATTATTTSRGASVDRGKYLVTIAGCNDCHTPWTMGPQGPAPDMSRMLSGHPASMPVTKMAKVDPPYMFAGTMTAYSGPWGISYAANLTPDSLTGIGAWTQDVFVNTLRSGKHMGTGRPILPPMPWQWFKQMTDDDLASVFMYLKSIPAISNKVSDPMMNSNPMGAGVPPTPPGTSLPHGVPPPSKK